MEWFEAEAKFNVKGISHSFKCIHNMPNIFGLSFEDALNNRAVRTKEYTFNSFRKYVLKKDEFNSIYLFSEEEWGDEIFMKEIFN